MAIAVWNLRWSGVLPAAQQRRVRTEAAPFTVERPRCRVVQGGAYAVGRFAIGLPGALSAAQHHRLRLSVDPLEIGPDPLPPSKSRIEPRIAQAPAPLGEPAAERRQVRLQIVHAAITSVDDAIAGIDIARFADGKADTAAVWLALTGFAGRGPFGVRRLAA
jgi:hypothetical protein